MKNDGRVCVRAYVREPVAHGKKGLSRRPLGRADDRNRALVR